ncbi:MAG: 2'-5' RNA ligase [Desulfovibrionales bacterium GWA2_65_9]|nr:MAG: 2'-5' RNA ligase [Desulfovibrionales bacterium GWA2_65_9]
MTTQRPTPAPALKRPLRCFIGLPLPEGLQAGLSRVAQRLAGALASRISWTRPGNWHLTLKFLGGVDAGRVPELAGALHGVDFAPFALAVGRAGVFPTDGPPRALWAGLALGAAESGLLAAKVDRALVPLGFAPEARPFTAHLTLGRVKTAAPGDDWALVERALAGESWPKVEIGSFVLWQSVLTASGPQYSRLAEFPARVAGVVRVAE